MLRSSFATVLPERSSIRRSCCVSVIAIRSLEPIGETECAATMETGAPSYRCWAATRRLAVASNWLQLPQAGSLIALIRPVCGVVQATFTWPMKCLAKASAPALVWALAAGGIETGREDGVGDAVAEVAGGVVGDAEPEAGEVVVLLGGLAAGGASPPPQPARSAAAVVPATKAASKRFTMPPT